MQLEISGHAVQVYRHRVVLEIANPRRGVHLAGLIRSYRSVDRTRLIAVVEATDPAAVAAACRDLELEPARAYTSIEYEETAAPGPDATIVVITDYDVPLTDADNLHKTERVFECMAAHTSAWVRSYLATDRRRMVCEFQAHDAENVRQALRTANVRFGVAWRAEKLEGDQR